MAEKTLLAFIGIILFLFFDDGVVEKKKGKMQEGKCNKKLESTQPVPQPRQRD